MPTDVIKCPHCQGDIQIADAVAQPIREQLLREFNAEKEKHQRRLADQQKQLLEQQRALQASQLALDAEVARQVTEATTRIEAQVRRSVQADVSLELQDLRVKLAESERRIEAAQRAELELRQERRALEDRQQALELEVARKVDQEKARLRAEMKHLALAEERLRLSEKEKIISDLQRQIEALRQKAEQGSQQLQGEVLELRFEQMLQSEFPADLITPVSSGIRGADLLQRVRDGAGQECGTLIWETKRTRNWSGAWTAKLKEDQRAHCADIAILLTLALPAELKHFGSLDGVWVTDFECGLALAGALRQGLISLANARRVAVGRNDKMDLLYQYLSGPEFRQKVEAVVDAFVAMKADLETEKRALTKLWAKREKQIQQAVCNTALLYGGVQGIVGPAALPAIQLLELDN